MASSSKMSSILVSMTVIMLLLAVGVLAGCGVKPDVKLAPENHEAAQKAFTGNVQQGPVQTTAKKPDVTGKEDDIVHTPVVDQGDPKAKKTDVTGKEDDIVHTPVVDQGDPKGQKEKANYSACGISDGSLRMGELRYARFTSLHVLEGGLKLTEAEIRARPSYRGVQLNYLTPRRDGIQQCANYDEKFLTDDSYETYWCPEQYTLIFAKSADRVYYYFNQSDMKPDSKFLQSVKNKDFNLQNTCNLFDKNNLMRAEGELAVVKYGDGTSISITHKNTTLDDLKLSFEFVVGKNSAIQPTVKIDSQAQFLFKDADRKIPLVVGLTGQRNYLFFLTHQSFEKECDPCITEYTRVNGVLERSQF